MHKKASKILKAARFISLPVVVFAAVWAFLGLFHSPYADWLTVETPAYAVVGSPLDVRITLGNVPEPSVLVVNVYLLGKSHKVVGRLPAPPPSPSVQSGGTYMFKIDVTSQEKMAFIQLVIWVSPTGDWRMRTKGANSEAIPIRVPETAIKNPAFKKIRAFAIPSAPNPETPFRPGARPPETEVFPGSSTSFLWALAVLLTASGLVCLIQGIRRRQGGGTGQTRGRRFWTGSAVILFLAVPWELFRLEERLSAWGRKVVVRLDLYYIRQTYQKAAIALIAAGIACILWLSAKALLRRRHRSRPALVTTAMAVYLGLALAGALSFHYMDVLRGISVAGASMIDLAKAACAAAVLVLGLRSLRKEKV
jgi:hypothetical protein